MTSVTKTSVRKLENYALGKFISGDGEGQLLYNAITGEEIFSASSKGFDFAAMCDYARTVGGPKLRKMTFFERGLMLKALAKHFVGQTVKVLKSRLLVLRLLKGHTVL